jgi:hypothetical protein
LFIDRKETMLQHETRGSGPIGVCIRTSGECILHRRHHNISPGNSACVAHVQVHTWTLCIFQYSARLIEVYQLHLYSIYILNPEEKSFRRYIKVAAKQKRNAF